MDVQLLQVDDSAALRSEFAQLAAAVIVRAFVDLTSSDERVTYHRTNAPALCLNRPCRPTGAADFSSPPAM